MLTQTMNATDVWQLVKEQDESMLTRKSVSKIDPVASTHSVPPFNEAFVVDLGPKLYRYFLASFDSHTSSDLVQEVFLRLIPKVKDGAIDQAKGDLLTYSYGIARNLRRETLRGKKKDSGLKSSQEGVMTQNHDPVFSELSGVDELSKLRRAIASLKEEEKEVVLLLINDDLSMEEIAKSLHMPIGTVKSHLHRARIHLKSILDPLIKAK